MEPARQKWLARLLLGAGVALALACLSRVDYARKVSTDVLDLIPAAERAPELALARSLAGEQQARVALFSLRDPRGDDLERAADTFADTLRASPAFAEVVRMPDTKGRERLGRAVFENRFALLFPSWLAEREREYAAAATPVTFGEWLAEKVAANLETFMSTPEAVGFQDVIPADPLLLVVGLAEQSRGLDIGGKPEGPGVALVWTRTAAPPLTEAAQEPVFAAVNGATAAAQAIHPGFQLQWTSIGRFAAENRERIQRELSWLNIASLAAVLAVAAACLRHITKTVHLVPVVLGALLGAWTVTTLAFDRIHVLVFVIGSLLGGVAIDYGFYLFLQPPAHPGEPYAGKVRRLLRPLLASAFTTVLGFSLLLWSELPLIRQLGVFVSAGLISALTTALLWFAQLDDTFTGTRPFARARIPAGRRRITTAARALLMGGAVAAVGGLSVLQWHDDIRELEALPPGMREEAVAVRAQFGETADRTMYLTRGESLGAARTSLERFLVWHAREFPNTAVASLGLLLPTPADWEALPSRRARLGDFETALRTALVRHGFEADAFAPFFTAWKSSAVGPQATYDAVAASLTASLEGPTGLTMRTGGESSWFFTVAAHPPGAEPPLNFGTVALDQLQSFNRLFSRYRVSALRLSSLGLALLGASVLVLYGLRRGALVFAVPAGSCLFALGVLGLSGQTMNLFHLLGAFLGVCLSHNYAIFSAENASRGDEPPPSIRLSALTTGASFGVLAFSAIPVVAALGSTVSLIVLSALVIVELVPVAWPASPRAQTALPVQT